MDFGVNFCQYSVDDFEEVSYQENSIQDITRLVGLVDVAAEDVTAILEAHDQSFWNEDFEYFYKELDRKQLEKVEK